MNEFLDNFYNELKNQKLDDDLIYSLKELISSDELSEEKIVELVEGVFDE